MRMLHALAAVGVLALAGCDAAATKGSPPPVSRLTAIWANDGGDKVTREDLRATRNAAAVKNRAWDGAAVRLFGARNEVVSFCLVLEAGGAAAADVSVELSSLTGPGGARLASAPASGAGLFDWRGREIELFYVRYLSIKGLSLLSYESYDERHVPARLARPWTGDGQGTGGWGDRPDHDRSYPDIAVPLDLVPTFTVAAGTGQSIWADVAIPVGAAPGIYAGEAQVSEAGVRTHTVPVSLTVRSFALPDVPSSKTMLVFSCEEVGERYLNQPWPNPGTSAFTQLMTLRERHFLLAHRHRISLVDDNTGTSASADQPVIEWLPVLDGSLFTAAHGYAGPGVGVGNGLFSIGTYGSWNFAGLTEPQVRTRADAWESWFQAASPATERFVYLIDESSNFAQTQLWAGWLAANPGPGKDLASFATLSLPDAASQVPSLKVAASTLGVGDTATWQSAHDTLKASGKRVYLYNGARPASGSWCIEDAGVALRTVPWVQFKKGIDRWFYWEATYYKNFQAGLGQTDVFNVAATFGGRSATDPVLGETGWNHTNGDGVLFYPGTDAQFPASSYGLPGPMASLRLKHWRRGIQDADYLTLAAAKDPLAVQALVARMVPKVAWENGVADPKDPTWVRCPISWSENPDDWEQARAELADIIERP